MESLYKDEKTIQELSEYLLGWIKQNDKKYSTAQIAFFLISIGANISYSFSPNKKRANDLIQHSVDYGFERHLIVNENMGKE